MSKHTPGPWEIAAYHTTDNMNKTWPEAEGQDFMVTIRRKAGKLIGRVFGFITNRKEAEANAKLISAAPELLEALEGIAKMDNKDFANSFHTKEETAKQIMFIGQLAKAAINKATT